MLLQEFASCGLCYAAVGVYILFTNACERYCPCKDYTPTPEEEAEHFKINEINTFDYSAEDYSKKEHPLECECYLCKHNL